MLQAAIAVGTVYMTILSLLTGWVMGARIGDKSGIFGYGLAALAAITGSLLAASI